LSVFILLKCRLIDGRGFSGNGFKSVLQEILDDFAKQDMYTGLQNYGTVKG
jgi:hypothetical protein